MTWAGDARVKIGQWLRRGVMWGGPVEEGAVGSANWPGAAGPPAAPAARDGVVSRLGLFGRLAAAGRVTEVSAPAGSGKTVSLRSWIAGTALAEWVAWVPVQGEVRDPQWFWLSVFGALRDTAAGSKLVRPLTAAPDLGGWAAVERLLTDLGGLEDRVWLVIDDVHELRSAEALRQLELLVMRGPPELRFVLATRHDLRLGFLNKGGDTSIESVSCASAGPAGSASGSPQRLVQQPKPRAGLLPGNDQGRRDPD